MQPEGCTKHMYQRQAALHFTVQLVPKLGSIKLMNNSHAAFKGAPPPSHHQITPIHTLLEHICPETGATFPDVWLDTAHVTFATLKLPAQRVQRFVDLFAAEASNLPDLSSGTYKIKDLNYYVRPNKRDAIVLDLESTSTDFVRIQRIWFNTLQRIARQVDGSCHDFRSIQDQHMTVRSYSVRNATRSFQLIKTQVQAQPATMQCAGLRIQQAVDQALDTGSTQGIIGRGYFYKPLARYPVPLYSSAKAASDFVRLAHQQQCRQKAEAGATSAAIDDVLDRLVQSILL